MLESLFIVVYNACGILVFDPCFVMQYLLSFISPRKRELVALL